MPPGRENGLLGGVTGFGGIAFGQMLIERPDEKSAEIIKKYLEKQGIRYEELEIGSKEEVA